MEPVDFFFFFYLCQVLRFSDQRNVICTQTNLLNFSAKGFLYDHKYTICVRHDYAVVISLAVSHFF